MEKTATVTILRHGDVVAVTYQTVQASPETPSAPTTPTRYWFAHLRNGSSYLISELLARDIESHLVTQNKVGR